MVGVQSIAVPRRANLCYTPQDFSTIPTKILITRSRQRQLSTDDIIKLR